MNPIVTLGIKAARRAGTLMLRYVDQLDRLSVVQKGLNDFVSEVDKMAEEEIIDTIHYLHPNHAILAEESGELHNPENVSSDELQWIIDPLDGTTNFLHGHPDFCVSIGVRQNGVMQHGIIFDPLRDELFTCSRNQGAQLNGRRIRVSGQAKLNQSIIATAFHNNRVEDFDAWLKCLNVIIRKTADFRRTGSAALDLAHVACGRTEAFWESKLAVWDMAAGSLMVREARGFVSDFDGQQNYLENGNLLAANREIFNQLLKIIKPHLGTSS